MSDINDELFNYELGDDIDDQAVLGVDEDELLLSDEELEQNVSKEEKQKLQEDAEQWVESQIKEENEGDSHKKANANNVTNKNAKSAKIVEQRKGTTQQSDVTSTTFQSFALLNLPTLTASNASEDYAAPLTILKEKQELQVQTMKNQHISICEPYNKSITDEAISCNNNQLDIDLSGITSCSTNISIDLSAPLHSSQQSCIEIGSISSNYTDIRDDFDDDREKRTNIKTTSERIMEPTTTELTDKMRFGPNKRNIPYQIRPHGIRNVSFYTQRPILRYPHGQFLPQQSANIYTTHSTQASNLGSNQTQNVNLHGTPNQLDPLNLNHMSRLRNPYPAFRSPGPINFRLPSPGIYNHVPHDYSATNASTYNSNFLQNQSPPRPIYRPEMNMQSDTRAGNRIQGSALHSVSTQNYISSPSIRLQPIQHHTVPSTIQTGGSGISVSSMPQSSSMRPSKVLINPNFKGGVEAATTKFIKETQFMTSISNHVSHLQSDEELLRQQEEFINNNRHHIEKRRNKRSSTPPVLRRSRSVTRSRSRSRNRSCSPPKRFIGSHFDRSSGSGSNNERFLDRDRERIPRLDSRERDRGLTSACTNRGNRFRRANSRDFETRNQSGSYPKRRRSVSPASTRSAIIRRAHDREKYDVEEDEETRAYRAEIEKQKALREKMLKDKELKRRKNLEDKLYEDKRATQTRNSNSSHIKTNVENQQSQEPQKLKPLIVTERRIISLKKRQQHLDNEDDNNYNSQTIGMLESHHIPQKTQLPSQSHTCGKQLTAAKMFPESKRTLTDHLTNARNSGSPMGGDATSQNNNISHMKFIQKMDINKTHKIDHHRLSSPNEDEVELDFDEDELMLEEEDRLLATPTPSPPPTKQVVSISPTRELLNDTIADVHNKNLNIPSRISSKSAFTTSRRIILKSSSPKAVFKSRQGNNNHHSGNSSRKGIFDRLDVRKQIRSSNNDEKTKSRRIVIKHD